MQIALEEEDMFDWFNTLMLPTWWSILSTILALVAFSMAFSARRKLAAMQQQITQVQNEIRALNSGALGMGRTIKKFASDIANVEINHLSDNQPQANDKTYQQASLLLSRGATIDEVVTACDMSPAEVELLAILRHSGAAA